MGAHLRAIADATPSTELATAEKELFAAVIRGLRERRVPFLIAGAFGVYHYSGSWRNTKDMDVLVTTDQFPAAVEVARATGLSDYYPIEAYDWSWIFRSCRRDVIVDIIHRFPNHVAEVDRSWFARGRSGEFAGEAVQYASPEDLIWMKLFVFQHERCDWPDAFNIIRGLRGNLDWERLLRRTAEHWRLLSALVDIYIWLCPEEESFIPSRLREQLARRRLRHEPPSASRKNLLDSRPWLTEPGAGLRDLRGVAASDARATDREDAEEEDLAAAAA